MARWRKAQLGSYRDSKSRPPDAAGTSSVARWKTAGCGGAAVGHCDVLVHGQEEHPALMGRALARHDAIVREAIEAHDGVVFASGGDGFGAAFQRSSDAVAAAIGAQRRLQSESWPAPLALLVRMGAHTGEAEERDGDYFGSPVNRAARVMCAAHGGQVLLSAATVGVLGSVPGFEFVDLGRLELKGLVGPIAPTGWNGSTNRPTSHRSVAATCPDH